MSLRPTLWLLGFLSAFPLSAQPRIFENGAVNAASFLSPETPGGALAQGSIFSVFGENLGPRGVEPQGFPLPTTLGGVQAIVFTATGDNFLCPLLYVSANQINAILPSTVPAGRHRLRIVREGETSNDVFVKVVRSSIGIFQVHHFSYGRPRPAGASFREPFHPGDSATLWATGLGPALRNDVSPSPAGDLPASIQVFVGDLEAEVLYQGRAPCCAGLDQINYVIPDQAPLGCFVPVWVEVAGDLVSNVVTLNLARPGGECEHEHDGMLDQRLFQFAEVELRRTFVQNAIIDNPNATLLYRVFSLAVAPFLPLRRDDIARTPPIGACLVPTDPAYLNPFASSSLEPITVTGPIGQASLARPPSPDAPSPGPPYPPGEPTHFVTQESTLLLEPGRYAVESPDSERFPAFSGSLDTGVPAHWLNRESLVSLARDTGLDLRFESDQRGRRKILASIGSGGSPAGPEFVVCNLGSGSANWQIPRPFLANIASERVELMFSDAVYEPLAFSSEGAVGWIVHRRDEKVVVNLGPPHLASTPVTLPSGDKIQAELATTGAERARGLMQRPILHPGKGMLFLFDAPGVYRFWMLNTLIPLDILWLDADRRITYISADTPPCRTQTCPTYGPDTSAQYVFEIAAGEAARRSLAVGDRLVW